MGKGIREAAAAHGFEPASLSGLSISTSAPQSRQPFTRNCWPPSARRLTSATGLGVATAMASGSGRSRGRLAPSRWRCLGLPSSEAPA